MIKEIGLKTLSIEMVPEQVTHHLKASCNNVARKDISEKQTESKIKVRFYVLLQTPENLHKQLLLLCTLKTGGFVCFGFDLDSHWVINNSYLIIKESIYVSIEDNQNKFAGLL